MARRDRQRAERMKRKARAAERREHMAARTEERNREARKKLEPLQEGERPVIVTIGAVISAIIAIVFWVSSVLAATGHVTVSGAKPSPIATGAVGLLLTAMAWGMWRARYWAALGFEVILAFLLIAAFFGLAKAATALQVVGNVVLIAIAGALFYFMVKAMARLQMPERRTPGAR